jgi:hypothetical protein
MLDPLDRKGRASTEVKNSWRIMQLLETVVQLCGISNGEVARQIIIYIAMHNLMLVGPLFSSQ